MSTQPTTVDGMIARLKEVWGPHVSIVVRDRPEGGWIIEAWHPDGRKVDARRVLPEEEY